MNRAPVCVLAWLLALASPLLADEPARPKIGLALSGGGARGAAHVGVLRVLEELHVPVDYIAGTSVGAIVGGLYAAGLTPDEIERALVETDWDDALEDRTSFKNLSYRRKEDETRYLTALEAGLKQWRLRLPPGLRTGQKLQFLLQTYLLHVATIEDFSRLPIPFRAVAADIETGEAVILDRGDLAQALRATMSIPGVFSPVEIGGKLLVDGGVANNLPVQVVRDMGADIVIAVDVSAPLATRSRLGSLFSITSQILTILTRKNADPQLALADLVITPAVSGYATMAFARSEEMVRLGEKAARAEAARLSPLAIYAEDHAGLIAARVRKDPPPDLRFVKVLGIERVNGRTVRHNMRTRLGKPLDVEVLRRDVQRLYGLDEFQQITFDLVEEQDETGLVLQAREKDWGPTYVRFSINLADDMEGASGYTFLVDVNRTRMNKLGAEWRTDLSIGQLQGISTEFYQPLDFHGHFFVAPRLQLLRHNLGVFDQRRKIAEYDVDLLSGGLDFGVQFFDWGELRLGVLRTAVEAGVETGSADLPSYNLTIAGIRSSLTLMRTDSPTIPHNGGAFGFVYHGARETLGSEDEYDRFQAGASYFISRGRQTFMAAADIGTNLGSTLPVYDEFTLGGLLNLGGFAEGQLRGQKFAIARLGTYRKIGQLGTGWGRGIYAGVFFETGNTWLQDESERDLHQSITVLTGADTVAGPLMFGYGRADTGDDRFYLTIGKTFRASN